MSDVKYEYGSPSKFEKLKLKSGAYFSVPRSLILDANKEKDVRRVTAFSFFSLRRGLDMEVPYSINQIVEWTNRKPSSDKKSIGYKFVDAIRYLSDEGYIHIDQVSTPAAKSTAIFDFDKVKEECGRKDVRGFKFAILWGDEVEKILKYNYVKKSDNHFNCDVLLLVFAYIRMMIPRRKNAMMRGDEDIVARRERDPEAWELFYKDIASDLGITDESVSKAVNALQELELIYHKPHRSNLGNDKWYTDKTLFCNFYKREDNIEFASGESYYHREIENAKKKLVEANKTKKKKT